MQLQGGGTEQQPARGRQGMSSSSKQVKRLYIQNFRGQRLPDDFEERNWAVLAGGVRSIFAGRLEGLSYESLYRVRRWPGRRPALRGVSYTDLSCTPAHARLPVCV